MACNRVGLPGSALGNSGARRLRVLGGVRHRALFPQRTRPDHLRGHDADPQDDAGRACTRSPEPERSKRRRFAALVGDPRESFAFAREVAPRESFAFARGWVRRFARNVRGRSPRTLIGVGACSLFPSVRARAPKAAAPASVRLPLSPATPGLSVRLWVVLLEARVNQLHSGPERRPGAAGLRGGRTHTGCDASGAAARGPIQPLRTKPLGAHGLCPCAFPAMSGEPQAVRKRSFRTASARMNKLYAWP